MKRILYQLLILLSIISLSSAALADTDLAPYWSRTSTVGSSAAACITTTPTSGICTVFAAGDQSNTRTVAVSASASVRCCWTAVVPSSISANLVISDSSGPNGSGAGACFDIRDASTVMMGRPNRRAMSSASGYRAGVCSRAVTNGGDLLFPPCSAGSDCSSFGAGSTCLTNLTSTYVNAAGMLLTCQAPTGTPAVIVRKLKATQD